MKLRSRVWHDPWVLPSQTETIGARLAGQSGSSSSPCLLIIYRSLRMHIRSGVRRLRGYCRTYNLRFYIKTLAFLVKNTFMLAQILLLTLMFTTFYFIYY